MKTSTLNPDLYRDLNQLEDDLMNFIEEYGPNSLSNPIINESLREKLIPKWADDLEVNSDGDMLYVRLILEDDYDSDINLNFNFYARIWDLYTPLLKSDIQDIRDGLEKHLGPVISQIREEGKLTVPLQNLLDSTVEKALKWIKFDSYDTEVEVNPDTGGYLIVNIYEGSTYISFHFDL